MLARWRAENAERSRRMPGPLRAMVPKGRVGWYHPVVWQLPENTRLLKGCVSVLCIRPWCRLSTLKAGLAVTGLL